MDPALLIRNQKKLYRHLLLLGGPILALDFLCIAFLDQKVSQFFNLYPVRLALWHTADFLTHFALAEYYFAGSVFLWVAANWLLPRFQTLRRHSRRIDYFRRWALNSFAALSVSGILTYLIKFTVGRERPQEGLGFAPHIFAPFNVHGRWQSFASGHSQAIFTAATMMSFLFPKWKMAWFIFAFLICVTRVVVLEHFLSDIIFGALVGYIGTMITVRLIAKKTANGL